MNDLEQIKKLQVRMANEVKKICEKYELTYFLDGGSMLGAVRHKGFIPWDDDLDIGLPREDYYKFLEVAPKELGEEYFLDNFYTNPENGLVFSKIRLLGTEFVELKCNHNAKHNEIFVDIFAYYDVSDNKIIRKIEGLIMSLLSQALMSKSGYKVWAGDGVLKRIKFIPTDILGILLTKKRMHKCINYFFNKHRDTKVWSIHAGTEYGRYISKNVFDKYIDTSFEDSVFKIPEKFDEFLEITYGDYMKLPPEDKRVTHRPCKLTFGKYKND